jgi:hypothetical protein
MSLAMLVPVAVAVAMRSMTATMTRSPALWQRHGRGRDWARPLVTTPLQRLPPLPRVLTAGRTTLTPRGPTVLSSSASKRRRFRRRSPALHLCVSTPLWQRYAAPPPVLLPLAPLLMLQQPVRLAPVMGSVLQIAPTRGEA